jgi:hypothetical protein
MGASMLAQFAGSLCDLESWARVLQGPVERNLQLKYCHEVMTQLLLVQNSLIA